MTSDDQHHHPNPTSTSNPTVTTTTMSSSSLQSKNWEGSIPIILSLAPSSLSSPTMPKPIHRMVSRQTFLHIAFENDIQRLHEYAPMNVSFSRTVDQTGLDGDDDDNDDDDDDGDNNNCNNDDNKGDGNVSNSNDNLHAKNEQTKKENMNNNDDDDDDNTNDNTDTNNNNDTYPICWFEDETTGTPLRWQFFVGIIYDFLKLRHPIPPTTTSSSQQHPHYNQQQHPNNVFLPWKIRIHFTSYPESILPISNDNNNNNNDNNVTEILFRQYMNSLKQSLFIQHNSNKIVNQMTKQSHYQIWDGIKRNQFYVYNDVAMTLNGSGSSSSSSDVGERKMTLEHVPIRVLLDSKPAFSRPCSCTYDVQDSDNDNNDYDDTKMETSQLMTIGHILHQWLPNLFAKDNDGGSSSSRSGIIVPSKGCQWFIQGIQVPLTCSIVELWKTLCHPDRFLYIIIVTRNN